MSNPNDKDGEVDESRREEPAAPGISLSLDATFDVLADTDRRIILGHLIEAPDHVATVDELVTQLVTRKADQRGEVPSPDSLEMQIHHIHLSKLVDVGLVEYDARSEELRYWPDDRLETWLQRAQTDETD